MLDFFTHLFDNSSWPPRWHCGVWTAGHGWLHILSDLGVWGAYIAIPLVLWNFVLRRRDIPFRGVFILFGAFILACGTTHLMEAIIFWWPAYRLAGLIKLFTAIVSWGTVIALIPTAPKVLALRTPAELEKEVESRTAELAAANAALRDEVARREQAEADLLQADRRKDEFLAMLAHELRNPLAPIRNAVQAMQMIDPSDPNLRWARDVIGRQVGQMTRLVDDLLDVSRITRGMITLRPEVIDLTTAVERAVETARPLLDDRGHSLIVGGDRPIWVRGDLTRLAQVFANLLSNSAKYTPDGGRVTISVGREDGSAVVRVCDTGMGISTEMLPRVFDLFTQADRSLARSHGGLGIGLSLVKPLVEMHGGTVTAQSDGPQRGSEFVIRLPLCAADERVAHRGLGPPAESSGPRPGRPRRVLVVDDSEDSVATMVTLLRAAGHQAESAADGPTAIAAVERFRPEVVILDIGLPGMDGYEVARRLRANVNGNRLLLVAVTGYGGDEARLRAADAGFDRHCVKPVDPAELQALLETAPV